MVCLCVVLLLMPLICYIVKCPIQTSLIQLSLLTADERAWLNAYHEEVLQKLLPYLEGMDEVALEWLKRMCAQV